MEAVAEQRQFAPGTMLDDTYRIDQLLAVGGMGAVYIGTHTKLRKRFAIKVLNPQISNPVMVERFHREAVAASQIGHEGIAQVTDWRTTRDGEPFLVMELLEGESLAKRIKATGPMPIDVSCRIGAAILSPLEAAHRAGIVHRDLKPDNVFLVRQSRGEMIKLLDFGIARATGLDTEFRLTTTGLVMGTPYYMSPEQARGEHQVTHLADIYAVGVILYEMVCGQVPITGENYNQLMFKVMCGDYRPPRDLRPDLPVELERIILASIALEPQTRPPSAADLEQALLPFCGTGFADHLLDRATPPFRRAANPVTAATVPSGHRVPPEAIAQRKAKRRVAFAGLAAVSIAGGIAAVVATTNRPVLTNPPVETGLSVVAPVKIQPLETPPVAGPATEAPPVATTAVEKTPGTSAEAVPTQDKTGSTPTGAHTGATASDQPTTIRLRFAISPSAARVYIDGRRVTGDELEVPRDNAQHKLRITARGYLPHEETIAFDETQKLAIELSRLTRGIKTQPTSTGARGSEKIESRSPYD